MIDKDRLRLINNFTSDLRKTFEIQTPIDIDEAIKKMGGTVVVNELYSNLSESAVIKTGDDSFIIRAKSDEYNRNFRLAQGLGQLFFLYGYLINPDLWNKIELNIPQKLDWVKHGNVMEINYFALSFLMPEEKFQQIAEEHFDGKYYNTTDIARVFNVTVSNASMWGKVLGVFE